MRRLLLIALFALTACTVETVEPPAGTSPPPPPTNVPARSAASKSFVEVVNRVEPVAERMCRSKARGLKCDFQIFVDKRTNLPPNAFQTLDDNDRPVIVFTAALVAQARNADEFAFILGHEAAHHIRGHIPKQRTSALRGALAAGLLARIGGASEAVIEEATQLGAQIGARTYSKEFELEADSLGAVIAHNAGYDARRGARYFTRIADPGNKFLGTHPPNAQRIETVNSVVAGL